MTLTKEGLVADGWRELRSVGFTRAIGDVLFRTDRHDLEGGFMAVGDVDNGNGDIVHGGALMTFADIILGFAASRAAKVPFCVTVQMTYQFAGSARLGDFVTCTPEIVRMTSSLIFTRALMKVGDRDIGTIDALFKKLDPR
jgi:acyl-coenzyme A thioesterase PaaI-like protein